MLGREECLGLKSLRVCQPLPCRRFFFEALAVFREGVALAVWETAPCCCMSRDLHLPLPMVRVCTSHLGTADSSGSFQTCAVAMGDVVQSIRAASVISSPGLVPFLLLAVVPSI